MTKVRFRRPSAPGEKILMAEFDRLRSQGDVRLVAGPAHEVIAAQRLDVFELLRSRKALDHGAYEAVRRLERDLDAQDGGKRCDASDRIDGHSLTGELDRRLAAGRRVEAALCRVRPNARKLLEALLRPQFAGILTRWRKVVEEITEQTREEVQTDRVREAANNLAEAYQEIDYAGRQRRA